MLEFFIQQYFLFILIIILFASVYINLKQWYALKQTKKESSYLIKKAYFDVDTELPNKKNIDIIINEQITRTSRHDKSFLLAVIKIINYHDTKNVSVQRAKDLIIESGNRILDSMRHEDMLARITEDEFLIVFNEYLEDENSTIIIQRIKDTFEVEFTHDKGSTQIEITIGKSKYPQDSDESDGLINRALHRAIS